MIYRRQAAAASRSRPGPELLSRRRWRRGCWRRGCWRRGCWRLG